MNIFIHKLNVLLRLCDIFDVQEDGEENYYLCKKELKYKVNVFIIIQLFLFCDTKQFWISVIAAKY